MGMFYPLYWISLRPSKSTTDCASGGECSFLEFPAESRLASTGINRFNFGIKAFKNYVSLTNTLLLLGIFLNIVTFFMILAIFFAATTCVAYVKEADAAYNATAPKYINF